MKRPNTDSEKTIDALEMEAYVASLEGRRREWAEAMLAAGWHPREYRGRNFYHGPAVVAPECDLQPIIRASAIDVTWDSMGKHDIVVHPL